MGREKIDDFMEKNLDGVLPGAAGIRANYILKLQDLKRRYPNILAVNDINEVPALLATHQLSTDTMANYLQLTRAHFKHVRERLHFIMVTQAVQDTFPDLLLQLPENSKNARHLYALNEFNDLLYQMMPVTLQSVKLPLSLFADKPETFQRAFEREVNALKRDNKKGPLRLVEWDVVKKYIHEDFLALLGSWHADIETLRIEQDRNPRRRLDMPTIKVHRPKNILPKLLTYQDVAYRFHCQSISAGARYALSEGWAKFELEGKAYARFTPGPMFGEPVNWRDYALGATVTVTVPTAIELVGEDPIVNAKHWHWADRDIFWNGEGFTANDYQQTYPLPRLRQC